MHRKPDPVIGIPKWVLMLRAGTGTILLVSFWNGWPDHTLLYGAPWWPELASAPLVGTPLLVTYSMLCMLLIGGVCPRLAAALLLPLHHVTFLRLEFLAYGFDYLCATALFYCAVIPSRPPTRWPLRMVRLSLCIMYAAAGLAKVLGPTWRWGEAIWKAATLPGFEGPLSSVIYRLSGLTFCWVVAGWLVILIELLYPLFVWFRPIRQVWLWLTVGMHLCIALVMGLYGFSAIMVLLNLVAFWLPYSKGEASFQLIPINYRLSPIRQWRRRAKPSRPRKEPADRPTCPDA